LNDWTHAIVKWIHCECLYHGLCSNPEAANPDSTRMERKSEANWLLAPKSEFISMFWMYWQKEAPPSIRDGSWRPPPVKKAD